MKTIKSTRLGPETSYSAPDGQPWPVGTILNVSSYGSVYVVYSYDPAADRLHALGEFETLEAALRFLNDRGLMIEA